MDDRRLNHARGQSHPVTYGSDFSKRHARLRHAEGAGIHAEKNHPLRADASQALIGRVHIAGIDERIIHVRDGQRKPQARQRLRTVLGCLDKFGGGHGGLRCAFVGLPQAGWQPAVPGGQPRAKLMLGVSRYRS